MSELEPCDCGHNTCDLADGVNECWGTIFVVGEEENSAGGWEWVHACTGHQEDPFMTEEEWEKKYEDIRS